MPMPSSPPGKSAHSGLSSLISQKSALARCQYFCPAATDAGVKEIPEGQPAGKGGFQNVGAIAAGLGVAVARGRVGVRGKVGLGVSVGVALGIAVGVHVFVGVGVLVAVGVGVVAINAIS